MNTTKTFDMGICRNGECTEPATEVNRGNRSTYCKKCNESIDRMVEALRRDYRARIEQRVPRCV